LKHRIYLSLGSNIAGEANLPAAVAELAGWGAVQAVSPAYQTAPIAADGAAVVDRDGGDPGAPFLNAALLLVAELEPEAAKGEMIAAVERKLGRVRDPRDRFAPRTIDVDIALWDDAVVTICGRAVPDPDIVRHLHVAQPLADIAPDYVHPSDGRTLAQIADRLTRAARGRGEVLPRPRPDVILLP
jgi:2-amino-4-hydroxy-6-hydroxymethyldihydropteridine diphosphokinase